MGTMLSKKSASTDNTLCSCSALASGSSGSSSVGGGRFSLPRVAHKVSVLSLLRHDVPAHPYPTTNSVSTSSVRKLNLVLVTNIHDDYGSYNSDSRTAEVLCITDGVVSNGPPETVPLRALWPLDRLSLNVVERDDDDDDDDDENISSVVYNVVAFDPIQCEGMVRVVPARRSHTIPKLSDRTVSLSTLRLATIAPNTNVSVLWPNDVSSERDWTQFYWMNNDPILENMGMDVNVVVMSCDVATAQIQSSPPADAPCSTALEHRVTYNCLIPTNAAPEQYNRVVSYYYEFTPGMRVIHQLHGRGTVVETTESTYSSSVIKRILLDSGGIVDDQRLSGFVPCVNLRSQDAKTTLQVGDLVNVNDDDGMSSKRKLLSVVVGINDDEIVTVDSVVFPGNRAWGTVTETESRHVVVPRANVTLLTLNQRQIVLCQLAMSFVASINAGVVPTSLLCCSPTRTSLSVSGGGWDIPLSATALSFVEVLRLLRVGIFINGNFHVLGRTGEFAVNVALGDPSAVLALRETGDIVLGEGGCVVNGDYIALPGVCAEITPLTDRSWDCVSSAPTLGGGRVVGDVLDCVMTFLPLQALEKMSRTNRQLHTVIHTLYADALTPWPRVALSGNMRLLLKTSTDRRMRVVGHSGTDSNGDFGTLTTTDRHYTSDDVGVRISVYCTSMTKSATRTTGMGLMNTSLGRLITLCPGIGYTRCSRGGGGVVFCDGFHSMKGILKKIGLEAVWEVGDRIDLEIKDGGCVHFMKNGVLMNQHVLCPYEQFVFVVFAAGCDVLDIEW